MGGTRFSGFFSPVSAGEEGERTIPFYQMTLALKDGRQSFVDISRDATVGRNVLRVLLE